MLEIPESTVIAEQLSKSLKGKIITYVKAGQSLHRFAFYHGNPEEYNALLSGKTIGMSYARGGMVEITADDCRIVFGDGATLRYYEDLSKAPKKHQFYMEFEDETALVVTVQMYGGISVFQEGTFDSKYYKVAVEKPNPLSDQFNFAYFQSLRNEAGSATANGKESSEKKGSVEGKEGKSQLTDKLSVKAFLATEQRIPGLGNGTLQDILFCARIHPKRKMCDVSSEEFKKLYESVKKVLNEMVQGGGRDTEKDLYGNKGGYLTYLSKNTYLTPCPVCGSEIRKANYLGGTIYYCEKCQK